MIITREQETEDGGAGRHQQAAVSELPAVAKCTVTQPRSSADTLRKTQGAGSPVNQERLEGRRRFGRMLASAWVVKPQRNAVTKSSQRSEQRSATGKAGGCDGHGARPGASGLAGLSSPSAATPCPHLPFWPQTHPGFPFSRPLSEEPLNASFCLPAASSGKSSQMTCTPKE